MNTETYMVACETLKPELTGVMYARHEDYPIAWVESGNHVWPDKLRGCIQEKIDNIPSSYKRILLVFGFCGNSMVGIEARTQTLVLPRVADCIPLFLGSQEIRESYGTDTYFLTKGYLQGETSFIREFHGCLKKYGKKQGTSLMKRILEHYKTLAVIDTGTYHVAAVKAEVVPFAEALNLSVSIIPGNLRLFHALMAGNWDQEAFLVVPPGESITLNDSLSMGKRP